MLWSRVCIISLSETHGVKPMYWKSRPLKMNAYFRTHLNWVGGVAQSLGLCIRNPPQNFIRALLVGPTRGISLLGQRPHGCHVIKNKKKCPLAPFLLLCICPKFGFLLEQVHNKIGVSHNNQSYLGKLKKKEVEKILNSYKSQMWDIPIQGRIFIFRILTVDAPLDLSFAPRVFTFRKTILPVYCAIWYHIACVYKKVEWPTMFVLTNILNVTPVGEIRHLYG